MPEDLRALIVVLVLSGVVFVIARPAMTYVIPATTFDRWRWLWFFTTLAWFLPSSIWIYVFLMVVALTAVRKKESYLVGTYVFLLFAAPNSLAPIPGFGLIDHFFEINHYRLLALTLLLPYAISLLQNRNSTKFGKSPVDWMVIGYLVLTWLLNLQGASFTNGMRMAFYQMIDGLLPYYVISRGLRQIEDVRALFAALLLGALLLSALAIFEVARDWRLYSASIRDLGIHHEDSYKMRGPFLRPGAAVLDSIVLGTVIVLAMGALIYLKDLVSNRFYVVLAWILLSSGLLASLSRAPWLAAILLFLMFNIQQRKAVRSLGKLAFVIAFVFIVFSMFPAGKVIIDLIPYVGGAEQGSIDYRANWFAAAQPLIERNFWFGDIRAMAAPELEVMRNGEGIIDLVNTFLSVLLHYGAIGLFFFVGMFLAAIRSMATKDPKERSFNGQKETLIQVQRSLLLTMMAILFTLSMISVIPSIVWLLIGSSVALRFIRAGSIS